MAKQGIDVQDIGIFSERSPRSQAQEKRLREETEKIARYVARLGGELEGLEKERSRMVWLMALGEVHSMSQIHLDECVRMIHDTRDNLEALKKEQAKTEKEITALHLSPAQSQARKALQSDFTDLARKRFAKTKQVEGSLQQLRQTLTERIDLADKMKSIAGQLECEVSGNVLDSGRFEECLAALPDDLLTASEHWQQTLSLS